MRPANVPSTLNLDPSLVIAPEKTPSFTMRSSGRSSSGDFSGMTSWSKWATRTPFVTYAAPGIDLSVEWVSIAWYRSSSVHTSPGPNCGLGRRTPPSSKPVARNAGNTSRVTSESFGSWFQLRMRKTMPNSPVVTSSSIPVWENAPPNPARSESSDVPALSIPGPAAPSLSWGTVSTPSSALVMQEVCARSSVQRRSRLKPITGSPSVVPNRRRFSAA